MPSTVKHITVSEDKFAYALENILKGVDTNISECVVKPIGSAVMYGAKIARWAAPMRTGGYAGGFTSKVDRTGTKHCVGTVYNKNKPGLVHLLEKGHRTIGGGWVEGRPHLSTAAEEAFALLERELDEAIEKGLQL